MSIDPSLRAALESLLERQRRTSLWSRLAEGWAACALIGLGLVIAQRTTGWGSALTLPFVVLLGATVFLWLFKTHRPERDWRKLAIWIETRFPELDGRLLTAVQMPGRTDSGLNYFQARLLQESMAHRERNDWSAALPSSWLNLARILHWSAFALFLLVLPGLRISGGSHLLARIPDSQIDVNPGDTMLEKGSSLVVLARFAGPLPAAVDLVFGEGSPAKQAQPSLPSVALAKEEMKPQAAGQANTQLQRIPLVKSLADPVFGGSITEVQSNLVYHVEYGGRVTRDYKVTVFEYPRLERADVDITFPEYTALPPKHIANTRRLSAAEGSRIDVALRLNKPVVLARLVPKETAGPAIPLEVNTNQPIAALKQFLLTASQTYNLQLIDAEGRTNKTTAQFVFAALTNRTPEFQLTSPRGDQRPSPLEELTFTGTTWDDFGLVAYGLGYAVPGRETRFIELGRDVPGKEKRSFTYVLRLEELELKPDQLVSWFLWADDLDSKGHIRRTTGDLFFGEIRPFEEVFREGMPMDGQSGGMQGQQGSPAARLTELQKQIINATWRLRREHPAPGSPQSKAAEPKPARAITSAAISLGKKLEVARAPRRRLGGLATRFFGQTAGPSRPEPDERPVGRPGRLPGPKSSGGASYGDDVVVVRDSQAQAIEQAEFAAGRIDDPREEALWKAAIDEMEKARARLQAATNSPAELAEALAAEQAAYQALLKVQQHEYQVVRNQNRSQGGGGGRDQQMQRQLEQMDLTRSENRYETQRQAQRPQNNERREDLQVMSRLQELARRQQDLNDRLKELQAALEEARTEQEREEIRRRLKRLQEEEQQMLADVDEVRQRMDRPENQSRMAEERRQLEQTREDIQKASEAAAQDSPSQALAAGTRAQRQLQQMRDDMRKKNSSQFADDLRQMRSEARDLARKQEELSNQMQAQLQQDRSRLSDSTESANLAAQLDAQKQRLTNLVQRATDISQQAEEPEPLLSRQLYDTIRKYTQDSARNVQEAQDDLLSHRLLTRSLYERLKESAEPDGAKLLDLTSELWRQEVRRDDFRREATGTAQRARAGIDELKSGVERAADSVLGDDTEALRLAQEQLQELTEQLQREMADADGSASTNNQGAAQASRGSGTNTVAQAEAASGRGQTNGQATARGERGRRGEQGNSQEQANSREAGSEQARGENGENAERQTGQSGQTGGRQPGENSNSRNGERQAGTQNTGQQASQEQQGGSNPQAGSSAQRGGPRDTQANRAGGPGGANYGGGGGWDWNRFWNDPAQARSWPLTGENFGPWSDGLRDVEEMIEDPALRNRVAVARERARLMRQEYKRDRKKPDWAVVRLQVVDPLAEVRNRIADELARRQSNEALVPIDRDPVPSRYSDLVRRYYEELGKSQRP